MKNIYFRTMQLAEYMVNTKCTIRQLAKTFGMAKSTVHYDLQNRLKHFNPALFNKVVQILDENFNQKNIRGGLATKQKYLKIKSQKCANNLT